MTATYGDSAMESVEVVPSQTLRSRERNAARTIEVLPPSKDEKLAALSRLSPERQAEHVTELLVHSHAGLLVAIAAQDLPGIAEAKQKASTIQEIAKQLRIGKDMQLHAAEFCRRAERGLGVAIRDGQERGAVLRQGEKIDRGANQYQSGAVDQMENTKPGPESFAPKSELHGSRCDGIYALTDNVSDEQFDEVLIEARDEGNLSRANVARKAKAKARKEAIDADDPLIDADVEPPRPVRKTAAARKMMDDLAVTINSLVYVIDDTNPEEVDADKHAQDIADIKDGLRAIKRFIARIENQ